MAFFPRISSAEARRRYSFGQYRAFLLDKVQSAQRVQYYFVFSVFRGEDKAPCLAVASEYSDTESAKEPWLGVFYGDGRLNKGCSPDWLDLEKFASEALRITLDHLGIPSNERVVVEEWRGGNSPNPWEPT